MSRDRRRALRSLRPEILDAQERHVLSSQADAEAARPFERFFRHIRLSVNQDRLSELWRSGVGSGTDGSADTPPSPVDASER